MTTEEFDRLVNRIQATYGTRPLALRVKIALWVALGYSGFLAVLLIMVMLAGGLAIAAFVTHREPSIILMGLVAVLLAFGLCQTFVFFWVPMEPRPAREVTRDEAPVLFDLLDRLQRDLRAAPFHHVRVTPDFNASVQMIPRMGVFGLNRSYLYLGLPLMKVISPEQFSAVLAHEFAHSSSRHDRFGMWIYRLRETWARVFDQLRNSPSQNSSNMLRRAILRFVDWYWPRFNAYAFVLSRANEYEADRASAEWAGGQSVAEALFRIECFGARLNDKFWDDLTEKARAENVVAEDFMALSDAFFRSPPDPRDQARWLETSAQMLTGNIDTHPSLADRLTSLGQDVRRFVQNGFPVLPERSASNHFLARALPEITRDVNLSWKKENSLRWQNVFHQARRLEKHYASVVASTSDVLMEAVDRSNPLSGIDVDQLWQQAKAICELRGTAAAEPLLRQVIHQSPRHSLAIATLGGHLIERCHGEGEQMLRQILDEEDNEMTQFACQKLLAYYHQLGQSESVKQIMAHMSRHEAAQTAAARERSAVTASDQFLPHELTDTEFDALSQAFAAQPDLDSAWLVRKDLKYFPSKRLFVLVARTQPHGLFGSTNADWDRSLVTKLIATVKLPGRVLIVPPQGGFRALARRVMKHRDAQVFPAG